MGCISSYFYLYAAHLRAFNLSNQTFSLPQNSQAAAFSHPCPVILTKSPHFPYLSLVPQNPPFEHFPSMASTLADEWRNHHPSRLHVRTHKPFAKGLTSISTSIDPSASTAADIPPTVRGFSLTQIWRPLEADAGVCLTPRATRTATPPAVSAEETSDGSDACDEAEAFCECKNAEASSSASSSSAESQITEKRKVGTSSCNEYKLTAKEMEEFILKLKAERRREVSALAERYPVSQFPFRGLIQDIFIEGKQTSIQEQYAESDECNWLTQSSYSRRGRVVIRRDFYNGLQNTIFIKNKGLKELLVIQEKGKERCISFSLPSPTLQTQKSWQSSSSTCSSSPSLQEGEDIIDLKYGVAQIHYEIYEIRKLVESCLNFQKNLGLSIKDEVFSAVNQLGERGSILHNSKPTQESKGTCCICREAQVDALLYRCGHMCSCYKCGQELEMRRGSCPICRSVIDDVVRAYQNH